ncbi:PIN domain-containing protein [Curtobacterium sp. MCJR17_020]|uniref:PIN domain-containing protein n=1 Tax=Curtobacterium sp. MCJR17_020 TaxID=2175619 RepID=UPI000DA71431|nr:PIN domain-containing protein [Curtobacterium sp. MCJR17_020]WIE74103.1 PIN domain-containing protein [Curtobacterium sp. MCJR17_020]
MVQRVFVDANVFVSRTLRDWICLLRAEIPAMFQLHTTEDVLAEALYTLRRHMRDADGAVTVHIREAILASIDEVLQDFDGSVAYSGSDADDRHVHAAAVGCQADVLLTEDQGFTEDDRAPYEVYTCDDFFCLVDDAVPDRVRSVALKQLKYWNSQPQRKSLKQALIDAGCPDFAVRVEGHLRVASGVRGRR